MCFGYSVKLTGCPHSLHHVRERCSENCAVPRGPEYLLRDCCAPCDPRARISIIRREHDRKIRELMEDLEDRATDEVSWGVAARRVENEQLAVQLQISNIKMEQIFSAVEVPFLPAVDPTRGLHN
jgi:hypothetical protein